MIDGSFKNLFLMCLKNIKYSYQNIYLYTELLVLDTGKVKLNIYSYVYILTQAYTRIYSIIRKRHHNKTSVLWVVKAPR